MQHEKQGERGQKETLHSYRHLLIWQKAFLIAKEIYKLTELFPKEERYGLISQLRRAGVSVVSNIAEGFSRKTEKEKIQFAVIAFGSAAEIETQLLLAKELQFATKEEFEKTEHLVLEVRKILNSYLLKQRQVKQ